MLTPDNWHDRIRVARELRKHYEPNWTKLHTAFVGRMMSGIAGRAESINPFAQFVEVVAPQLLWDEPAAIVQPLRVSPGTDPAMATEFARILEDQATAIGRAIRLRDELISVIFDFFWSCGVMLYGFNAPAGMKKNVPAEEASDAKRMTVDVDVDFARSGHREFQDAGMPFARCISPYRFLGDHTFGRFERGDWCGFEEYVSLAEFRAMYKKHADDVQATHNGEPVEAAEEYAGLKRPDSKTKVICLIHTYSRDGQYKCLADQRSRIKDFLEEGEYDLGIEGLPIQILGRSWPRTSPYPIPPLATWYGAGADQQTFLDKIIDEASKVRSIIFVDEGPDSGLAEQIRNSENQGVIAIKGNPKDRAAVFEARGVNRDDVEVFELTRRAAEIGSGISEFQLGRRQTGDMTATEASALQGATTIRMESMRGPVLRFAARSYQNIMAITYSKIDLMAGTAFPLGIGENLRYAVVDPNRPMVGEILDYQFDVGTAETAQLSREQLGKERKETLEQFMRPDVAQKLAMEGYEFRIQPLIEEGLRELRSKKISAALVPLQAQPPPEATPAEPQGPQQPPSPETMPPPAPAQQEGEQQPDPIAEYQQVVEMLTSLPDGDPQEDALLARMVELRGQLRQMAA